jgi:hypothetical protein
MRELIGELSNLSGGHDGRQVKRFRLLMVSITSMSTSIMVKEKDMRFIYSYPMNNGCSPHIFFFFLYPNGN